MGTGISTGDFWKEEVQKEMKFQYTAEFEQWNEGTKEAMSWLENRRGREFLFDAGDGKVDERKCPVQA